MKKSWNGIKRMEKEERIERKGRESSNGRRKEGKEDENIAGGG